jgi:hyaluronate lyase
VTGAGILSEEAHKIEVGRAALFDVNGNGTRSVLGIVTSDDGFYQDGSYISHHIYPYAGGYGLTHILAVSHEASVLHKTSFALSHVDLSLIYESIRKTFTPFVFRGMVMGNVRGELLTAPAVMLN